LHSNISFSEALEQNPTSEKFMKELATEEKSFFDEKNYRAGGWL